LICLALFLFCLLLTIYLIRRRRTGRYRPNRRRRYVYWIKPKFFLTRHEYEASKRAYEEGLRTIERRKSTGIALPLVTVRKST
jgi:hypothetical protein